MIIKSPEPWESSHASELGLSSLERLGAFFTSQIHDLNNQIAVLSNSELLLPEEPISSAMTDYIEGLFGTIRRLSATCEQFNVVRKIHPVDVEKITLREAVEAITGAVGDCKGWQATSRLTGGALVFLNTDWLPLIVSQLLAHMQATGGTVDMTIGELPPRQYQYPLRGAYNEGQKEALLIHFKGGGPNLQLSEESSNDFPIALELVRLQGAGISLTRSDSALDYLLAFRLHRM